jgi:hypothetical protein
MLLHLLHSFCPLFKNELKKFPWYRTINDTEDLNQQFCSRRLNQENKGNNCPDAKEVFYAAHMLSY